MPNKRCFIGRIHGPSTRINRYTEMKRKTWVYDPHSGGTKIPNAMKPLIRQRILEHAQKYYAGRGIRHFGSVFDGLTPGRTQRSTKRLPVMRSWQRN